MGKDKQSGSFLVRALGAVERAGNKLPSPVMLFVYCILIIIILSFILSVLGISANDPRPKFAGAILTVKNLVSIDGLIYMLTSVISNFVNFPPLGTVLVSMIGIGLAERSGLIEGALKGIVQVTPKKYITAIVVFSGVMSNVASEVGYIVLVPLGAIVFYGFGRHPLAGFAAAFAGVSGGYSANLLIGTVDPLLAGISQEAARFIDTDYIVGAQANWYFMGISTFLITILGTVVTDKIVEPALGTYDKSQARDKDSLVDLQPLNSLEKKALKVVGIECVGFFVLLFLSVYPGKGILLNQQTMSFTGSPFLSSIIAFVLIFFAMTGLTYGYITKNFHSSKDVIDSLFKTMSSMGPYVALTFFMAQFIAYFGYTNIAFVSAVSMAEFIKGIGSNGPVLLVSFIFIAAFANLFIGSASAKWALLAPVFIPMFMLLGYAPEVTQTAYRIGDSSTNIISPMMSYLVLILYAAQRYVKDYGIGGLVALMLPYSIVFLIAWTILLYVWVFLLGLPVGPGANTYFTMPQ